MESALGEDAKKRTFRLLCNIAQESSRKSAIIRDRWTGQHWIARESSD
jgi:hypothetical protein